LTPREQVPPASYAELVSVLQQRMPTLTPAQRLLAERVMADPESVAFMTVSELAATANVNESTVVRFAAGIGLDGYPGLTRLCRAMLRDEAQLLRRFARVEDLAAGGSGPTEAGLRDPLELATAFDQANIARTMARVDRSSWSAAVDALAEAPRVHVLGLRKCHSVAFLLGYLLRMVRDEVRILTPGVGTLVEDLRGVRPGDCFVGVSIHRYSRDTVRGFRQARARGATTVALTDNPSSPLAIAGEHAFYVETVGVSVLRSLTAFTSLVQALANAVAAARGAEARSALVLEERLLDEFDVYEDG
jgi:DNA-binding MurR/RpiR family transcriptional regulator